VLRRDVLCVLCGVRLASVADHYPMERRELVASGLDPNDPRHGRGLCTECDHRQGKARQDARRRR
jgi:5-methylcytosine-specific restriction protein A